MRACPRPHADAHATSPWPRRPWRSRRSPPRRWAPATTAPTRAWRATSGAVRSRPTTCASRRSCACRRRRRTTRRPSTAARRAAPYGPDTCLNGYVWREAVASDHVCVTPPRRQQARNDNAQAAARRDAVRVWLTSTARPSSRAPATRARTARTTRSASACAPTTSTWARRPCSCTGPTRRARRSGDPQVGAEPERAGRPARLRQRDAALLGPPNAYFAVRDPVSLRWSARVQRADRLLHALREDPSARRRPCGKGAGGAPRCLVQAAAGRNGAAWAMTRRQAGALSRGRRARLCRVWRGSIRMPSAGAAAPMRLAGVPEVRVTRPRRKVPRVSDAAQRMTLTALNRALLARQGLLERLDAAAGRSRRGRRRPAGAVLAGAAGGAVVARRGLRARAPSTRRWRTESSSPARCCA